MPHVGNKKFAYTKKGEKSAIRYSKEKGMPMMINGKMVTQNQMEKEIKKKVTMKKK